MSEERIKIAIQKSGRLTEHSISLLQKCGLIFSHTQDQLIGYGENMPFDLMFVRDDDIPDLVQNNFCQLGIVGLNTAKEKQIEMEANRKRCEYSVYQKLDFGQCSLAFAYPEDLGCTSIEQLESKTIATSYPSIVSKYIDEKKLDIKIIEFSGAVELAPSLGIAQAVCDLVSSGNTLKAHNLAQGETILESTAVVIQSSSLLDDTQQLWVSKLFERINGVLQVRESKYIMMHAPKDSIKKITELLPGTESPTIIPLEGTSKIVAVHVVCKEAIFWETLEDLKSVGASSILVVPVEKMLM